MCTWALQSVNFLVIYTINFIMDEIKLKGLDGEFMRKNQLM